MQENVLCSVGEVCKGESEVLGRRQVSRTLGDRKLGVVLETGEPYRPPIEVRNRFQALEAQSEEQEMATATGSGDKVHREKTISSRTETWELAEDGAP